MISAEPTLVVGLGGAGGHTVARLKSLVEQTAGEVPPAMAFLWLDTDADEALDPAVGRVLDPQVERFHLAGFNPRAWIEAEFNDAHPAAEDVREWYDTSARALVRSDHFASGPARMRMLGRICLFKHRLAVEERVHLVLSRLGAAAVEARGAPLGVGERWPLRVVVVAGTSGGLGSGTFLDVVHMVHRVAAVELKAAPRTDAFLYLPDLYIRLNQRVSDANAAPYQANAWAFFDELDYFLEHPDALNDYVMDARSADRRPSPEGTGLPAGTNFLETAFLIDAKIPGVGVLERPRDLYAYAARAILQAVLGPAPAAGGAAEALAALARRRLGERDAQRGRPKRYAALGYAELAYPRNVFAAYLARRYENEAIAHGILRQSDALAAQARDDGTNYAGQILSELVDPAVAELRLFLVRALETLPAEADFLGEDGRLDLARFEDAVIRGQVEDVLRGLERVAGALRIRFGADRARVAQAVAEDLERRIDTGGEGLGLPYLLDFLAHTDRVLETVHERLRGEAPPEAYTARFEEAKHQLLAKGGAVERLVKGASSYFGAEQAARQRLPDVLALLREAVEARLEGELSRARTQLVKAIAGDPEDRDPDVEGYDARTGETVMGEVSSSVVARAEDTVIAVMNVHLSTLLAALHVDQVGGKLFKTEGEALTTRYVVPASSLEHLRTSAILEELFQRSSGLSGEEVTDEVVTILGEAYDLGLSLSKLGFATYEAARLAPLVEVLDARSQARFAERTGRSVGEVLARLPESERERLLAEIVSASAPALALDESVLDPVADPVVRVKRAAVEKPEAAARLEAAGFSALPGSTERLAVQELVYGFPLYAVRGLLSLQRAYAARDRQRSFPHIHRRFNERGLPESLGREAFPVSDEVVFAFVRAHALSQHVLERPAAMAKLGEHLQVERERFGDAPRFALIDADERDGAAVYVLHLIDQDPERHARFRVHSPLQLGGRDLRTKLVTYARLGAYVENHRRFADSLEILAAELGASFLREAYEAYLEQLERELAEARTKRDEQRVRALLAMERPLRAALVR